MTSGRNESSQFQGKRRAVEPFAGPGKTDRSLSCEGGRSQTWSTQVRLLVTQRVDSGNRTRRPQIISLLLCPVSYIRMDAEGPDYRRHTVLQRSRTSEAVGTSTISDHRFVYLQLHQNTPRGRGGQEKFY